MNNNNQSRIYFAYSPNQFVEVWKGKGHETKIVPADRGVIALKKEPKRFVYGVSVCTIGDSFDKGYGRKLAEQRLNKNFGVIKITKETTKLIERMGEHRAALHILKNLADSVGKNPERFKRRIERFNISNGFVHGTVEEKKKSRK